MNANFFVAIFISSMIFFSGCGKDKPLEGGSSDNPSTSKTNHITKGNSQQTIVGKVIKTENEMLLISDTTGNGLYQISSPAYNGDISDISPGDLIEVGFDGMILEMYPAIVANPDYVVLVEKGEDFVGFYCEILLDLFQTDPGLNSDISFIALDLTEDKNLSESEKIALLYLLWNATQIETRLGTYDDLLAENLITIDNDTKFAEINKGILMKLESSKAEKDQFIFTAEKWRTSLDAYWFTDCESKKENGKWSYGIGKEMIS